MIAAQHYPAACAMSHAWNVKVVCCAAPAQPVPALSGRAPTVAGASRLIRQREFTTPPSSKTELIQWINGSDPVAAWVATRVEADPHPHLRYKSAMAHQEFRSWAIDNGYRADNLPAVNGFVQRLLAEVPTAQAKHTRSGNWIKGIVIRLDDKPDPDEEDEPPEVWPASSQSYHPH